MRQVKGAFLRGGLGSGEPATADERHSAIPLVSGWTLSSTLFEMQYIAGTVYCKCSIPERCCNDSDRPAQRA